MAATVSIPSTPLVVAAQPVVQQPVSNLRCVKGLAVTQLIIGAISVILGVVVIVSLHGNIRIDYTGAGMWAGGWISITGMIGLCHAKNGRNISCLYMAFNIVSSCMSGIAGLITGLIFNYFLNRRCGDFDHTYYSDYWTDYWKDCKYYTVGEGLYASLMVLMIIELIVSIVAAALCCKNNGCGGCECCYEQQGTVIRQQPYMPVVTRPGGPTVTTAAGGYPRNVMYVPSQYGGQMMPQYGMQMQPQYNAPATQLYAAQMQTPGPPQATAVVSHDPAGQRTNAIHEDKPPAYNEIY